MVMVRCSGCSAISNTPTSFSANMQTSLADMKDILRKIDDGRGSVGLAVNDPSLYYDAKNFLGGNGSLGWGVRMLNGIYSLTHPFSRPSTAEPIAASPVNAAEPAARRKPHPRHDGCGDR